ncbi:MAG TPA: hypothetical protein DD671_06075, partial [Balneolaceae bacterium]|nr:hypothetical protein [Balneolaceae bacterium]
MRNLKSIFLLLLFCLSLGQGVMAFSGIQPAPEEGQIQPVDSSHDEDASPSALGYLVDAGAPTESLLLHTYRLNSGFSESSQEDDERAYTNKEQSKSKGKAWLFKAETIERSLTFRELIY